MAVTSGNIGGSGGAGGASSAASGTTRINVIDPHLVQMMRDVLSSEDTTGRLSAGSGPSGGGGGGAMDNSVSGTALNGGAGLSGGAVVRSIVPGNSAQGGSGGTSTNGTSTAIAS